MSSVCKPTETAAYSEYDVSLYSCIIAGLKRVSLPNKGNVYGTYLLTGSLIAVRKSWACSAIGEKASKMIWPSSGLIQSGRERWSCLRCSNEKSWPLKISDIDSFCWLRCTSNEERSGKGCFSCLRLFSATLRVSALSLITAPRGMYDESGGEGGITSSSFAISR